MSRLLALSVGLGLSWPACAQDAAAQTRAEVAAETSHLSNGSPDWREQSLRIVRAQGVREVRELGLVRTERFGLKDHQISGLYSTALSSRLTGSLSAHLSPTHRVLARRGLGGTLQYEFAPAWLVHTGLSTQHYDTTTVKQASLMLEHYFSAFSVAAVWRPVRALDSSSSSTELRGAYYYDDTSFVALSASSGQEAVSLGANKVELAGVRGMALTGRHRLSRPWAVTYAVSRTEQGNFYNRNSVRLGAQYLF